MGGPFKTNYAANTTGLVPDAENAKPPRLPSLTDETVQQYARAQAAMTLTGRGRRSTMTADIGEPMLRRTTLGAY